MTQSPPHPSVLVVDDDTTVADAYAQALRQEGYDVRVAANGEEALPLVAGVQGIVLDVRMPVLDGVAFLRRLRADDHEMPVLIVTGDFLIDDALVRELEQLGGTVVFKPLWLEDLVIRCHAMLERAAVAHAARTT